MKMNEFYKKYKLNKSYFASMAGVGTKSLIKYDSGEDIKDITSMKTISENY